MSEAQADRPVKAKVKVGDKLRGADKVRTIPLVNEVRPARERKPDWIRVRVPANGEIQRIKSMLRKQKLHTVCEEAACPNLPECFGGGTATFMIMGDICTRRCSFCDVGFGRPNGLDPDEPKHLAESVADLGLKYVVITSVDRDDLPDGGAAHFAECIREVRALSPDTKVENLTPDFRPCLDDALDILDATPPDVFNHNIETVPHLYKKARPGARYQHSLDLLQRSDAVVMACPRTPETYHLIGDEAFKAMKKSAFLVNVTRGGIIDEEALARALHAGEIAGAGVDVFDIFFFRVGVVESQIAGAVVFSCQTKVQTYGLGMTDVQVPIWFWWKTKA